MTLTRGQILTFGPMMLVTISYVIAAPSRALISPQSTADETIVERAEPQAPLSLRCRQAADDLTRQLPSNWALLIREPFILGGDLPADHLDQHYQHTIVPTVEALRASYFQQPLRHPISVIICSSDERFRECNLRLEEQELSQYSGLYSRKHRRIIVNIASGEGTLAHELTHAMAHTDFPTMPEWFDEGLASLHEECEFSADGLHLIGNRNWREQVALDALNQGELRLIEDITSRGFGTNGRAQVDYAHVRSLCLYLQGMDRLEAFYAACRASVAADPTGLRSLCHAARCDSPREFDDAFRVWLIARDTQASK